MFISLISNPRVRLSSSTNTQVSPSHRLTRTQARASREDQYLLRVIPRSMVVKRLMACCPAVAYLLDPANQDSVRVQRASYVKFATIACVELHLGLILLD